MAESKLGVLTTRVFVDRGKLPHYGTNDAITGKIVVGYLPYKSIFKKSTITSDFFGPLVLGVTLRGKVRVKIKRRRDTVISSDYGTRLFMQHFDVFNGSFKAEVGQEYEFPFVVNFPEWIGDSPIPPSFSIYFSDYPDRVDAAVVYKLGAKITTPGIKVETSTPDYNPEPEVRLDQPRPSDSTLDVPRINVQQKAVIQNKNLLPEADRPSGLRQNFKAAFSSSSLPIFTANITCTSIHHAYAGLRPQFSIAVRAIDGETTAPFFPDVLLNSFVVKLIAHTEVDTSERIMASGSCFDSHTAQKLLPWGHNNPLPASLSKMNDHSIEIEMEPFGNLPSSFAHPKISRKYFLEIKAGLKIADTSVGFSKQFPVEMLPSPHTGLALPEVPQPGPSRISVGAAIGEKTPAVRAAGVAGPSRIDVEEDTDQPPPAYDAPQSEDGNVVRNEKI